MKLEILVWRNNSELENGSYVISREGFKSIVAEEAFETNLVDFKENYGLEDTQLVVIDDEYCLVDFAKDEPEVVEKLTGLQALQWAWA